MDVLVVVDMQNDFISGSLGTPEAVRIVPSVIQKIKAFKGEVLFTRDTHSKDYLKTQEGRNLPVEHCIKDSDGWALYPQIAALAEEGKIIDKPGFGSLELPEKIKTLVGEPDSITLIGLCTDICVISNAMILKAFFPETPIWVDATCCAGVTPESHERALESMKTCQIGTIHES